MINLKKTTIFLLIIFCLIYSNEVVLGENIKIGIEEEVFFTTIRTQPLTGKWKLKLYRNEGKTEVEKTEEMLSGEDAVLMYVPKGIIVRLSSEKMLDEGYHKIVFSGGDLINIEVPNRSPKLMQGELEVTHDGSSLVLVNTLPIEDYIISCTSTEVISCEPEAVKAHIVVVESKIRYLKAHSKHPNKRYELCDSKHCTAYTGKGANRELVELLYHRIPKRLACYKGKPIYPRYHDTCGGKISSAYDVYGLKDEPYHVAHNDLKDGKGSENCFHSPSFHWTIETPLTTTEDFLSMEFAGGADNIYVQYEPLKVNAEGRILMLRLKGKKVKEVQGIEFLGHLQNYYGINSFKSMRYTYEPLRRTLLIRGMGEGDGVGMCLYGADGLAKKGSSYREILSFYYPGTELE